MSDSTEAVTTSKVIFTTWRDTARGISTVQVRIRGEYVGKLEMDDWQLLAFSDLFVPLDVPTTEADQ